MVETQSLVSLWTIAKSLLKGLCVEYNFFQLWDLKKIMLLPCIRRFTENTLHNFSFDEQIIIMLLHISDGSTISLIAGTIFIFGHSTSTIKTRTLLVHYTYKKLFWKISTAWGYNIKECKNSRIVSPRARLLPITR